MQILIIIKKRVEFYVLFTTIFLFLTPTSAFSQPKIFQSWVNIQTHESFSSNMNKYNFPSDSIGIQQSNNFHNFRTKLALTISQSNKKRLLLDQSFLEYKNKESIYGIGKINRNWSFSKHTSLILSNNARPGDSIYFIKRDITPNGLVSSWIGPWSFEAFNSKLSSSSKVNNPMLLGMRLILEPSDNLKFELLKTSQWGGSEYSNNISAFSAAILGNTNESNNSNINQMAGFGLSFKYNLNQQPIRTYAQIVGEDESGSLPSCLTSLVGSEVILKNKLFSEIGFEYVDTRIDTTEHGFCGPQTAYSNIDYPYVNYGKTMGTSIDSEGKIFNVWASTKISENIDINYSIKHATINDFNTNRHRLSDKKESGWITTIGSSWKLNSLSINSNFTYQDLVLNKSKYKDGLSFNINTSFKF
jgi:hypothetical protein